MDQPARPHLHHQQLATLTEPSPAVIGSLLQILWFGASRGTGEKLLDTDLEALECSGGVSGRIRCRVEPFLESA